MRKSAKNLPDKNAVRITDLSNITAAVFRGRIIQQINQINNTICTGSYKQTGVDALSSTLSVVVQQVKCISNFDYN